MLLMPELLTIGEVARRSGVASSALRFYEERGMIRSERSGSGHRRFQRPVLRRIAFIVFAQRIGLTLDEIGSELEKLPADRVPERDDWERLSSAWGARIEARIAELRRLQRGLTECIGCGCLSLERCKLSNPGDSARDLGPGPRYWIGDSPNDGRIHSQRLAPAGRTMPAKTLPMSRATSLRGQSSAGTSVTPPEKI